jgi:hypothetical protein
MGLDAGTFALVRAKRIGYRVFYAFQHPRGLFEFSSMFNTGILECLVTMWCKSTIFENSIIGRTLGILDHLPLLFAGMIYKRAM